MDLAALHAFALDLAADAGSLAALRRAEGVDIAATKSTLADIVTAADREVEGLIRERIERHRPDDGFLGEETGHTAGTSGITWIVDPIDGTVNYAAGIPLYGVSIAAVTGEPRPGEWTAQVGVVDVPATRERFHAVAGGGAWLGDRRLHVTADREPAGALLATGFGYDRATYTADLALLASAMPLARGIRRMGAASIDLAYVAAGRMDAYFERGLKPWDHAAGALLVTEAGGDVAILEPDAERPLIVASAAWVTEDLRARLDQV
ncbi:inositol monophosphatase family protein [Microbacterium gorillae]|uniref:inositol monophosphatase family protein n=1 Tax=Microbacterium gorillae TaxID=1231063 RepID=UPI0005916779|nr:inositol monophosphatase family protein [Microbacterium gorillae]